MLGKPISGTQKNEAEASWGYSMPLNVYAPWFSGQGPKVHFGVGCDYCGVRLLLFSHPVILLATFPKVLGNTETTNHNYSIVESLW